MSKNPSSFGFNQVIELIEKHGIQSVDQLVPKFPRSYRSIYSLVYETRNSVQHANLDSPRVILSGKDAKFLTAFTGDASHAGGDLLETIEFNSETKKFDFKSIRFTPGKKPHVDLNPASCFACHRGHPIWESYRTWPGIYGSGHLEGTKLTQGREYEGFERFVESSDTRTRYRHLVGLMGQEIEDLATFNTALGIRLNKLNAERIVQIFKERPGFEAYRLAFVEAGLKSGIVYPPQERPFEKFIQLLPVQERKDSKVVMEELDRLRHESESRRLAYLKRKLERLDPDVAEIHLGIYQVDQDFGPSDAIAKNRFLSKRLDIDFEDLFLPLDRKSYETADGIMDVFNRVSADYLQNDLKKEFPKVFKSALKIDLTGRSAAEFYVYPDLQKGNRIYSGEVLHQIQQTLEGKDCASLPRILKRAIHSK